MILGARRRRSRRQGQLLVSNVPSATLKFDTDFDFDLSNAQFKKEELETEMHHGAGVKGWGNAFDSSFPILWFSCDVWLKTEAWNLNVCLSVLVCLNGPFVFAGCCGSALKEELPLSGQHNHFGPKFYYDKAKSFFDNISSDMKFRWSDHI